MATITIPSGTQQFTAGLLGVDVSDLVGDHGIDGRMVDARRLEEVERRILAIEAKLHTLEFPCE
jgi:hypothetical protein